MALVMIVTRDVADRYRGFLASVMLEVSPIVYVAPRMNKAVRERVWAVMCDWHGQEPQGSLVADAEPVSIICVSYVRQNYEVIM